MDTDEMEFMKEWLSLDKYPFKILTVITLLANSTGTFQGKLKDICKELGIQLNQGSKNRIVATLNCLAQEKYIHTTEDKDIYTISLAVATEKKSNELIKKIRSFGSNYEIDVFHRRILHGKRIKTMNDKVLKNLDSPYLAIERQKQITFQYMRWNPQRKLEVQKAGKLYQASPYGISLNEDNYYLIAYDNVAECLKGA